MGDFDTHEWVTFITFHKGIDGNLYAKRDVIFDNAKCGYVSRNLNRSNGYYYQRKFFYETSNKHDIGHFTPRTA